MVGKVTISPRDQKRIKEACEKSGKDPERMISTANSIFTRNANNGKSTRMDVTKGGTISFSTDEAPVNDSACAANSLSILFRGWLWNGYSMDDAYASIRGVAYCLNVTMESEAIKLFGGINQVGINLRYLSGKHGEDSKGLTDLLDDFYVHTIIPEVYNATFLGKMYLRILTSYLGAGFLDGAHEETRLYWTHKYESGSILVEYVKQLFLESDPNGNNPSIQRGLRALDLEELEMALNKKRLAPEKGIGLMIYNLGLKAGGYIQRKLNFTTEKKALGKMREEIGIGNQSFSGYMGYQNTTTSLDALGMSYSNMTVELAVQEFSHVSLPEHCYN